MKTNSHGWRRLLAAFLTLSLLATACGSDGGSETSSDASTESTDAAADAGSESADTSEAEADTSADEAEAEPTPEPVATEDVGLISDECAIPAVDDVEIDIIGWEFPIVTQYADEFDDCEDGGYEFNYQFLDSTAAREQMTLDAATGSPEFELYQGSNAFIIELANQGYLRPLNDMIDKYSDQYDLDQIDPAFFDLASLDGDVFAIPAVSNTMHLFYNEPEMAAAGVEVPTTFDEAFEACAAIQDAGYDVGFMYMLSAGWSWQIEFDSVLGSLGKTNIDPVTGEPQFNSPEGIEAANLLKQMHEDCGGNASGTYSTDDIQAAFQTGEVILGHTWASRAAAMDDPEASTVVGDIQFAPALDAGGGVLAAPAYIDGWGIPTGTPEDQVEAIFLAMMAATDQESQEAAAEFGLVTRQGVTNANGPRDGAAAATSLVNGRGADLTHPAAGIARAKLGDALITILDGTPVEEALASAEEAYLAEANDQGLLSDAGSDESAAGAVAFDNVISDECAIPAVDDVEIDVIGWEFPIITQYADELEDCEDGGYEFNIQFLDSTAAREQMTLDAATGSPEFELYQGSNAFIIELANQGYLRPLNDMIDKYSATFDIDEIDPAFIELASIDGQIYSVPMVSNTMHLFYNEPEMAAAGVEVPTTFDEAFEACAAIQDAGYDVGFMYMLSAGWSWQIEFDSVLGSLGKTNIDPVTGEPQFNSPEGIEAANLLKQMHEDCGGNASGTYSTDDIQAAFQTGEVILGHTWASRAAAMDDPEASTVVGDIQFAPALDAGGGVLAAPAYIDGWGIPTGTPEDQVEAIFLAMMAATDQESQEAAAEFGLVTRQGVTNANGPRDGAAAATSLVNGRGADLTHPAAGIARAKLGDALITILDGTPVEEALASAEEAYLAEANDQGLLDS